MTVTRGTTNGNARGSSYERAARRAYLLAEWAADVHVIETITKDGDIAHLFPTDPALEALWWAALTDDDTVRVVAQLATARCFHCGTLLFDDVEQGPAHITVDRIVPGFQGGTYRRTNIRPACAAHNSELGGKAPHAARSGHKRPRRPEPGPGGRRAHRPTERASAGETGPSMG